MSTVRFPKLLEPGKIGGLATKNRIIKATSSMGYQRDEVDGHITPRFLNFCEAIARGGVGLTIVEGGIVDYPLGGHDVFHFRIDEDEYVPDWAQVADVIHKHGCGVLAQMVHAGPWHRTAMSGLQPIAASADIRVEEGGRPDTTREASVAEIKTIIGKFADAADRYRSAGFDGVEINASGNHLLNSFLSRGFNRRLDAYGCQSLENRARIVIEILQAIKARTGSRFVVGVLFNGMEYGVEDGLTIEETKGLAGIFERNGADYLHVRVDGVGKYLSSHYPELIHYPEPPKPLGPMLDGSRHGAGGYVPVTAAIKKAVSIPVVAVGRLDPPLGEEILREGKADFVALNKRLLADPELPNKLKAGRLEEVAPCTACEHCISFRVYREPVRCRINAALGSEGGYEVRKAEKKKVVVVVGGGPAGLEAARVAALRGHHVTLFEKESRLGGLLPLAALVKGVEGEDLIAFTRYFEGQLKKLGVKTSLGREVEPERVLELRPDAVIVAVGGLPNVPAIPGADRSHVVSGPALHHRLKKFLRYLEPTTLRWLTKFWMPLGKKVVILGGAIQGAELAEFLVKRGRLVTLVAGDEAVGQGLPKRKQQRLVEWLEEKGATTVTQAKVEEITAAGVVVRGGQDGPRTLDADSVVPAPPFRPNTDWRHALHGRVGEVHLVGDCREPRLIIDAIAEGWRTASVL